MCVCVCVCVCINEGEQYAQTLKYMHVLVTCTELHYVLQQVVDPVL